MSNEAQNGNFAKPMLSPVVLEAILNDAQIKALQKGLNDLVQYQSPKYVLKTNGEFEVVYSEEYNRLFAKFIEQIEHRQSQIVSAYNWR
jgi:hypothetical protein